MKTVAINNYPVTVKESVIKYLEEFRISVDLDKLEMDKTRFIKHASCKLIDSNDHSGFEFLDIVNKFVVNTDSIPFFEQALESLNYHTSLSTVTLITWSLTAFKGLKVIDMDRTTREKVYNYINFKSKTCPIFTNLFTDYSNDDSLNFSWRLPIPLDISTLSENQKNVIENNLTSFLEQTYSAEIKLSALSPCCDCEGDDMDEFYERVYLSELFNSILGIDVKTNIQNTHYKDISSAK